MRSDLSAADLEFAANLARFYAPALRAEINRWPVDRRHVEISREIRRLELLREPPRFQVLLAIHNFRLKALTPPQAQAPAP